MALWILLLGISLNLCQDVESQGLESQDVMPDQHVTGVLGEEVYLHCFYTGKHEILASSWNRLNFRQLEKKIAGYKFGGAPFTYKESFSIPMSLTNLTVKVSIDSLDMEGQYTCGFTSDEEEMKYKFLLSVIAKPGIKIHEEEDILNGTHYQTVSCSALNAKPMAHISWEIRGVPLNVHIFSIYTINATHPNGTSDVLSVLRFPILFNNESKVTCVVQHQALTEPSENDINLKTFVSPNVTMDVALKQKESKDVFQVLCTATGGRPLPEITWILPTSVKMAPSQKQDMESEMVASSHWFPSDQYEGENITCIFGYSLLPAVHTRTVTLPIYYITSLQLKNSSSEMNYEKATDIVILEGDKGVIITTEVLGNVPSYKINCSKDGEPMPKDVDVIGSDLLIKGPVNLNLSGQYLCQASYHKHRAFLQFNIEVKPRVILPESFPPNISINVWKETGNINIECLASDASPAANISWILPQDLHRKTQYNITCFNGLQTARSIVSLPECVSQELTVKCVVEHLALAEQQWRQISLPICVPSNITLQSKIMWENNLAYVEVNCSADVLPFAASITWDMKDCRGGINASEPSNVGRESGTQQDDAVGVWRTAHLSVQAFAGCNVTCVLKHRGLEKTERKSVLIPSTDGSVSRVNVGQLRDSALWAAVCDYRGDAVVPNISWVISKHNSHNSTTVLRKVHTTFKGIKVFANTAYDFNLSDHEGKNLTCVIRSNYGKEERKTVHIPKYFISSIIVLNKTIGVPGNLGHHTAIHGVTLQEGVPNQRIIFRVNRNTPEIHFKCFRADQSPAHTVDTTLVFPEPASEQDAALYTCHALWYHHKATAVIQVDVTSQDNQIMIFILICFSSATAISVFLFITFCILCKRTGEGHSSKKVRKQRESLAGLMQTPCSPELNKALPPKGKSPEYAELVHYSIVLDVKSTV
ncbi:uncharacterized protein si:ch211-149e23.4 [Hoplias malabaricus]|uniref:uncharacterized protein si:ch211-149e23.4 n=1 Tax=Hoplias malabaricus TaxID=27720 RepID=UPI003461908F